MEHRIPKQGEIYRHFKGNLYEVIVIARDSETLEEKVVYKELNGEAVYVRSLPMFVSVVDREKYPDVSQKYRFELVEKTEFYLDKQQMIMEFLDKETSKEKINYLLHIKENITESFLEIVAQSLDFVENEGSVQERLNAILQYLETLAKFETGRLR